jgi:hypothetical protein
MIEHARVFEVKHSQLQSVTDALPPTGFRVFACDGGLFVQVLTNQRHGHMASGALLDRETAIAFRDHLTDLIDNGCACCRQSREYTQRIRDEHARLGLEG